MKKLFSTILVLSLLFSGSAYASCYEATIMKPSPFMGNNGEVFTLDDGTYWEVGVEYEFLFEFFPKVLVCPNEGFITVEGKKLSVKKLK